MSFYNLIKEDSRIRRCDTIEDLHRVTGWRRSRGLEYISPKAASIKRIENAVALMLENIDTSDCPELVRSKDYYISLLPEIYEEINKKERKLINSLIKGGQKRSTKR